MFLALLDRPDTDAVRRRLTRLFGATAASNRATTARDATESDPSEPDVTPRHQATISSPMSTSHVLTSPPPGRRAPTGRAEPPFDGAPSSPAGPAAEAATVVPPVSLGALPSRVAAAFGVSGARLDPGGPGAKALLVLAAVVVAIAAGIAWWSQPRPESVGSPHLAAPTLRPSGSATGVVVAVAGKVRHPGLVTLPPGARVADAIKAAGGLLPGTKIGYLNLARKVSDGELIVVGATPAPGAAPGDPAAPGAPAGKIDLNTATLQQLDTLPGVGPVLAQRILDYRQSHGGFRSVDELRQVDGIGPSRYEQLKDLVSV